MKDLKYKVIDRLVPADTAGATRRHVFKHPDTGKEYAIDFYWNQEVEVEYWIAEICLMVPEGFSVFDSDGQEYELREPEEDGAVVLRHDQVIAQYSELTLSALKDRAEKIHGYTTQLTSKDALITFLMMKRKETNDSPEILVQQDENDDIEIDVKVK